MLSLCTNVHYNALHAHYIVCIRLEFIEIGDPDFSVVVYFQISSKKVCLIAGAGVMYKRHVINFGK